MRVIPLAVVAALLLAPQAIAADPVVVAAGDIASCASSGDEATAALIDARPNAIVATLGDNVYEVGTLDEFMRCYEPSWGRHKARTRPSAGNHEYKTTGAAGYFDYFGAAAGPRERGYYSYDVGAWHVVVLNTNCTVVACAPGSAQEQWLRADLAASSARCTLAYGHHPRFSSGFSHGGTPAIDPLWRALYEYGADVYLAGHEHHYERFAPLSPSGASDPAYGIRSWVVGTGGKSLYGFGAAQPGSEARYDGADGILELTLRDGGYGWRFVPTAGTYADAGTGTCHDAPAPPNLLRNPGFDNGSTGWASWNGTITTTAGVSGAAARVTPLAGKTAFSLFPTPKPVASATAGTYTGTASVRSSEGVRACAVVREWSSGTVVGYREACVTAGAAWQRIPAVRYAARSGTQVEVYVYASGAGTLDVDDVSLTYSAPDTEAPDTRIDSGPAATTQATTARFTFSATEAATFECSLDGGAWYTCSSPHDVTVAPGQHVFRARATDAAGNTDGSPAEHRWTVEQAPPPPDTNLAVNGSFESGLTAWRGWNSSLALVQGVGGNGARVTQTAASGYFSILPTTKPVLESAAGVYVAAATVRSATPGREVCVNVREWSSGTVVGLVWRCVVATGSWERIPELAYTARGGTQIEVFVDSDGATGTSFDVDDVSLSQR